jgi:SPP1 gp7 family putative phage head morphogenesis protein
MAKKQPPHLVMAKWDTIQSKDPFQTSKEEAAISLLFEKRYTDWIDSVKKSISKYINQREMAPPSFTDIGISALETDDLKVKAIEYVKKGYIKGVQLGSQSLEQLNIDISINLGNKLQQKSIDSIQKAFWEKINQWTTDRETAIHDIVMNGLTDGKTLRDIINDIDDEFKKGLSQAKRDAQNAIIDAARIAEMDTLGEADVDIFRWITIADNLTCETCMALNGRMYMDDPAGRGMVNYDTGDFLEDELAELTPSEDFIDPSDSNDGPPIHSYCRCHFQPVITQDKYKGTVNKVISEV